MRPYKLPVGDEDSTLQTTATRLHLWLRLKRPDAPQPPHKPDAPPAPYVTAAHISRRIRSAPAIHGVVIRNPTKIYALSSRETPFRSRLSNPSLLSMSSSVTADALHSQPLRTTNASVRI
ncbi:hypothetical protein C8J57DRAFT_1528637 [Mycena rebaudengoi]|nr:hypothetical protein C8J57DRAFT_1528637 [Mycena rebaudengoi]